MRRHGPVIAHCTDSEDFPRRCFSALLGVKTLRTQDTLDPRHFGTSAEVSVRQFGTSAELSGHFGTSAKCPKDTSALRKTLRHRATMDGKVDG